MNVRNSTLAPPPAISATSPDVLEETAHWIIRLRYETADDQTRDEFAQWLNRHAAHAEAWGRAQQVLGTFERLPPTLGKQALQSTLQQRRRAVLRVVVGTAAVAPLAWISAQPATWHMWTADAHTRTGEQRAIVLPDGSSLVLNTASAVDVVYTPQERRVILLSGEIWVTTASESSTPYRPFIVQTKMGDVRALGTQFTVRDADEHVAVTVLEHAVELQPKNAKDIRISAGQQVDFNAHHVGTPTASPPGAGLWTHGMFIASDMRLDDLLIEINRYRPGIIRCDPAVAGLKVSGAIALNDTDAALTMLTQTLPLKIKRISRYWVVVQPQNFL